MFKRNPRKLSLYFKFKLWCSEKKIPFLLLPTVIIVLVGVFAILVGGTLAGWDIAGALRSKTAYLIYAILVFLIGFTLYSFLSSKNKR